MLPIKLAEIQRLTISSVGEETETDILIYSWWEMRTIFYSEIISICGGVTMEHREFVYILNLASLKTSNLYHGTMLWRETANNLTKPNMD